MKKASNTNNDRAPLKTIQGARILIVTPHYIPYQGGVETHVREVAVRIARLGIDVTVMSTDGNSNLPAHEYLDDVKVLRVAGYPRNSDLCFAPGIHRVIVEGDWDLIHCQSIHTLVPAMAMYGALQRRIPYLITTHMSIHSSRIRNAMRPLQWALLHPLLKRAKFLIAVSEPEAVYLRKCLGYGESVQYIPNGADLPTVLQPAPVSACSLILSVGRLDPLKGHQRVIRAFSVLLHARPNLRLQIVGMGDYEDDLRKLIQDLGISDKVLIQGIPPNRRSDMSALLSRASLVTLLSDGENNPIAVLEALGMKRPVLVTNVPGLRQFADLGVATSVPLNGTPEEVAQAMLRQLDSPLIPQDFEIPTWDNLTERISESLQCGVVIDVTKMHGSSQFYIRQILVPRRSPRNRQSSCQRLC